jgi:sec-independent protein translocase protein TatA
MGPHQLGIVMNILAFGIGNLGGPDLLIILLIVSVLFGAKKLPDLARSLGQSMNEFRKARQDLNDQLYHPGPQPTQPPSCQQGVSVSGAPQANSASRQ